jgi:hypothetical protein
MQFRHPLRLSSVYREHVDQCQNIYHDQQEKAIQYKGFSLNMTRENSTQYRLQVVMNVAIIFAYIKSKGYPEH